MHIKWAKVSLCKELSPRLSQHAALWVIVTGCLHSFLCDVSNNASFSNGVRHLINAHMPVSKHTTHGYSTTLWEKCQVLLWLGLAVSMSGARILVINRSIDRFEESTYVAIGFRGNCGLFVVTKKCGFSYPKLSRFPIYVKLDLHVTSIVFLFYAICC